MQQLVLWGGTLPRLAGHRLLPRGCLRPTRRRDVAVPRLEPHAGHRPPVRRGAARRAGVRVRRSHRSARRRRSDGRAHPICVVADAFNPMPTYGIDEQFQAAYSRLNDTPTYDPSGVRPGNPDPARPDQLAWPPDPAMTHVRVDPDGNPMTRADGTPWNVMPGSYRGVDDRVVVNGRFNDRMVGAGVSGSGRSADDGLAGHRRRGPFAGARARLRAPSEALGRRGRQPRRLRRRRPRRPAVRAAALGLTRITRVSYRETRPTPYQVAERFTTFRLWGRLNRARGLRAGNPPSFDVTRGRPGAVRRPTF